MRNNLESPAQDFKSAVENSNRIFIASHLNPDGDNIGSMLAMGSMLASMNKDVYVVIDDFIPRDYKFLPNLDKIIKLDDLSDQSSDLFIALDCADLDRMGRITELFPKTKTTVNIDHHVSNRDFADINIVDRKAAATGEVLYRLYKDLDYKLNKDVATSLFTAISSDTGSFKYDSVTDFTFTAAADLMNYGIDTNEIAVNLYQSRSVEKTNVLIEALSNLKYYHNDKVALVKVTRQNIIDNNAHPSDTEGIVEFIRDIESVELAVLLKEKRDSVKLSLRSKSYIDATKIAGEFQGGGHIRAAGATIHLPLDEAEKAVLEVIDGQII